LSISGSCSESKRSAFVVPAHFQSPPQFFIGHIQVALRLLNARVAEHQLNDADVDTVGQQSAGAFVSEIVPAQVDPLQLLTIPLGTFPRWSWLDAMRE
jgi:hypothetical protein